MRAWPLLLAIVAACHGEGRTAIDAPLVFDARPDSPPRQCPAKSIDVAEPTDYLDTMVVIGFNGTVGLYPIQLRLFTDARVRSFYTERGLVFDDTRAHVLVFQSGDRFPIALDKDHGTAQTAEQRYSEEDLPLAWTAGNTGAFVLFPNVDASTPTAKIAPDFGGPLTVPVRANMLTLAVTCAVLL